MPQNEKVVETKICKHCGASFDITNKDLEFYEKISPVFPEGKESCHSVPTSGSESLENKNFNSKKDPEINSGGHGNLCEHPGVKYENGKVKYLIPSPTFCPDCREQRRMSFRNERSLYKRKCDFNGKDIISIYSPDKPYKVYDQDIWWSDKWDALKYGPENGIDFNRNFFEQFEELAKEVPKNALFLNIEGSENSDFTNHSGFVKNCYSCFAIRDCENCLYDNLITNSQKCIDCLSITQSTLCYFCIDCTQCFHSFYCVGCESSNHLSSCYNCIGCQDCIGCHNLVNKKFYIENIAYSQEEYREKSKQYLLKNAYTLLLQVKSKTIFPQMQIKGSENCYGDQINNSKNLYSAYNIYDNVENSKYVVNGLNANYVYDAYGFGDHQEKAYEIVDTGAQSVNQYFCVVVHNTNNAFYCQTCYNCSNLFGCIGLKNKKYCILNKEYSQEKYEKLVPRIIEHMQKTGEWGEFFPASISPFGYNETVAMEYFPLDRDVAMQHLYNWSDYEPPFPKVTKIIPANKLPENIADIPDDILNWAIECEITKKPFKIIKEELDFYRKHNLPIPKRHPDERHKQRMKLRNPRKLYKRNCDKCGKEIETTYAPERPEIVYCEKCYNREIY